MISGYWHIIGQCNAALETHSVLSRRVSVLLLPRSRYGVLQADIAGVRRRTHVAAEDGSIGVVAG